jgi:hypothetical protein
MVALQANLQGEDGVVRARTAAKGRARLGGRMHAWGRGTHAWGGGRKPSGEGVHA